jgi:hypothetical protein
MVVTTGAVMSATLFGLREFRDAGAFLSGARIPITHVWPLPFQSVEWAADHFVIENDGRLWKDDIRPDTLMMLAIDLSDPDVIRWCDRKIAEALGIHDPAFAALSRVGNRWVMFTLADELDHEIVGAHPGLYDLLRTIPEDDEYLPDVRAALLRHLYGSANV